MANSNSPNSAQFTWTDSSELEELLDDPLTTLTASPPTGRSPGPTVRGLNKLTRSGWHPVVPARSRQRPTLKSVPSERGEGWKGGGSQLDPVNVVMQVVWLKLVY